MPVIVSLLLFFVGIYCTEKFTHTGNQQSRSIASVSVNQDQKIREELEALGKSAILEKKNLTSIEYQGRLLAEADDTDPNHKKHKINYFVEDDKKVLQPVQLLNEEENLVGNKVVFRGMQGEQAPIGYAGITQTIRREREPYYREHKMLILLFKFNNSMTEHATAEQVYQATFNGAFQQFFRDMSGNKDIHTGKVYGFYHLNRNGDDDGGSSMPCDVSVAEIKQAAAHYQINLADYNQITTVSNCSEYFTIGGRANLGAYDFLGIGKAQHYIKMASKPEILEFNGNHPYVPGWGGYVSILVHERGHNFGLSHSNALDCLDSPILYPCSSIEYGNTFDRMGGPDGSFLFNAYQQERAGWKKSTEFLHIKTPGIYTIDKLTSTKNNRKIGAYIYNPSNPNQKLFMLEYRIPEGMDNNLSAWMFRNVKYGAHLYTTIGTSTESLSPSIGTTFRIVDPHPSNLVWQQDTAYESLQGEYLDVKSGIKITTYAPYSDSIEFKVDFDASNSVCNQSSLPDWSTDPYVRLYYDLKPVSPTANARGPVGGFEGGSNGGGFTPNPINLPPYSKEVRRKHIVLIPGDFFHLKIDTLIGESMICDRTNIEIQLLNQNEIQTYFTSSMSSNSFKKITKNINQKVEFPLLKVPAVELNRDRMIRFQIKNKVTGETMVREVQLHIRSSHNAIIKLDAENHNVR